MIDFYIQSEELSEETHRTDAIISPVIKPEIKCYKQNLIAGLCLNPQCQYSLVCNQEQCQNCGLNVHEDCNTVTLTRLTNLINRPIEEYKKFVSSIESIEDNLVKQIKINRNKLTQKYPLGNLLPKYHQIVDQIYNKKDVKGPSGKKAEEFYRYLIAEKKLENTAMKDLLGKYHAIIQQITGNILEIQKLVYYKYVKKQALNPIEIGLNEKFRVLSDNLIKNDSSNKPVAIKLELAKEEQSDHQTKNANEDMPKLLAQMVVEESRILSSLDSERKRFLHSSLKHPRKLKLLFRASQHAFKVQAFHKKCDHFQNTLTVVRTQYGKTIAGFTKYEWNSANRKGWVINHNKEAFLLQLDLCEKYICQNNSRIIYCNQGSGPRFGNDLVIRDDCNTTKSSYSEFPRYYNKEGPNRYDESQESCTAFCGATEAVNFNVDDYEVFEVLYQ